MRIATGFIIWIMMSFTVSAVGVDEIRLSDPAQEARAQSIMKQLRCLVCQNQSIVDSNAPLAKDLRVIVRERIMEGDDDQQVLFYMTSRYGDWVLLKPPFDGATIVLWLSPILLLMIGFFVIYKNQLARNASVNPQPLSADEKKRLKSLLNDRGNK